MARPSVRGYGGGFMDIHPEQGSALAPPLVRCSVPVRHTQYPTGRVRRLDEGSPDGASFRPQLRRLFTEPGRCCDNILLHLQQQIVIARVAGRGNRTLGAGSGQGVQAFGS
jgi:hypothetical protein